jgi:hypothetical protein
MMQATRNNRAPTTAILAGLVVLLSISIPIFGQVPKPDKNSSQSRQGDDEQLIVCRWPLVVLDVEVRDAYLRPISNLTHMDFSVFEDGIKQKIDYFRQKNVANTEEMAGQYEIAYYPPSRDGEYKRVQVKLRDDNTAKDNRLKVINTPKGYYAIFEY